jgi:hypothetical protein
MSKYTPVSVNSLSAYYFNEEFFFLLHCRVRVNKEILLDSPSLGSTSSTYPIETRLAL